MKKFPPAFENFPHMIHGGDYNPDQWLDYPEVLSEDLRLMKLAGINSATVAIFAWSAIEPYEGVYTFEWLDKVMDDLYKSGVYVILATPSGARPVWLSEKYPEVLRVNADRTKNLHGKRHNHCFTSKIYRKKVQNINRILAERYKDHPAVKMWHLSNEYSGECHCDSCTEAFRDFLKDKYENNIEKLNHAWWTYFWSHKYTSFDQIDTPSPLGENAVHGMNLDWKRFVTHQTADFIKAEIKTLREVTPNIPITTNLMGTYEGLNYWEIAKEIDIASWDSYPEWHTTNKTTDELASEFAFRHDLTRSLKGKPFLLMESTPSLTNWQPVNKLKRPGMHLLSSLHAVAHGSDSVQYFQWRKSRGSSEKLHGAVVDHVGHENTRVFRDVQSVGNALSRLDEIVGTATDAKVAIVFDWENRWAINDLQGLNNRRNYEKTVLEHYKYFNDAGISVDVTNLDNDLSKYKLVIAPMLYMLRDGVSNRLESFVNGGGTLVTTYLTGYADKNDLCFLGGFPGEKLRKVIGIWAEEIDALFPNEKVSIEYLPNSLSLSGNYEAYDLCEIIHAESAKVIAQYTSEFYKGSPVITENDYGSGKAYHIAARTDESFLKSFYKALTEKIGISPLLSNIPESVHVTVREDADTKYLFVMNFSEEEKTVSLDGKNYINILNSYKVYGKLSLKPYEVAVLKPIK